MNEKLEQTVNTILQKAVEGATAAGEFLKDQIPDVVQQLLTWKLAQSGLVGILCVALVVAIAVAYIKLWKCIAEQDDDAFFRTITGLCALFGATFLIFLAVTNLLEALKIWLAPKVWLLEYAAQLVK